MRGSEGKGRLSKRAIRELELSESMKVGDQHFRTIWLKAGDECFVQLIDQRFLPHRFVIENVSTIEQMVTAIREMHVRWSGVDRGERGLRDVSRGA